MTADHWCLFSVSGVGGGCTSTTILAFSFPFAAAIEILSFPGLCVVVHLGLHVFNSFVHVQSWQKKSWPTTASNDSSPRHSYHHQQSQSPTSFLTHLTPASFERPNPLPTRGVLSSFRKYTALTQRLISRGNTMLAVIAMHSCALLRSLPWRRHIQHPPCEPGHRRRRGRLPPIGKGSS